MAELPVDPDQVSAMLRAVGQQEVMPRFGRLDTHQQWMKAPGQLVTEADQAAEAVLEAGLTDLLPGSAVVGEEGVALDPARIAALSGGAPVWVIDPVDGTANFAAGEPVFGMTLALLQAGTVRAAWIYDPVADQMAWTVEGQGAFLDDRPARLSPAASLAAHHGSIDWGIGRLVGVEALRSRVRQLGAVHRLRCASQEYLSMLRGAWQFKLSARPKPWDHLAGMALVTAAGGMATRLDGAHYDPADLDAPLLAAADRDCWDLIGRSLTPELTRGGAG